MKIKASMPWVLGVALVSFFILQVPAANADTIEYQLTGVGPDLGTNVTIISNGFLTASDFPVVPTTATDLFVNGVDEGAISSIILTGAGTELEYVAVGGTFVFAEGTVSLNFPTSPGTFTCGTLGVETCTGVVTDLGVTTPEPRSDNLLLAGLGLLGLIMLMRNRAARGLPQAT